MKASISAVLAYSIYISLGLPGAAWAAPVSAVLVTQPTFQPSIQASLSRFWANILGALIGSISVLLLGPTPWALGLGLVVAGFLCQAIRLDEGLRPAYVSVVIVIFTGGEKVWVGSFDRVLAVLVGCVVALIVGAFCDLPLHRLAEWVHRRWKIRIPGLPLRKIEPAGEPSGLKNAQE
ncbi:Aromatic acid exporter family member 1 [Verrucomicrobium sp. GAS474]|nr:Aromatic acid exporter family member 1 [Verrucomicrobium sp. GAS474]